MADLDNMSRAELLEYAKSADRALLSAGSQMHAYTCPFCYGNGWVGVIKCQVREAIVSAWHAKLTQEEVDSHFLATYGPPKT